MIKRSTLVWMLLAATAIGALFAVKYEVQALEDRLAATNRDVMENLEAVHVLRAEWAYLNQPARLEDLGRRLLDMEPVAASEVTTIADVPFRVEGGEAAPGAPPETAPGRRPPARPAPLLATMKKTR